ncbi:methionine ABC transporter permease [Streptococcus gallolyticus]|uniref:methionine ABC transporter permease n=1 Tax=Streptococcus gallolyticus TaxID=315405 RepID=UPI000B23CADA|nr:ABC transporter permease subunit [Streptococcus gallolyticus]MCY7178179.1 ABC transporter permease subunit [Streptococcus gallolyticus subsp. gallolyticus]MCY7192791.1 ABC transporter permease subunit [Streptococcus gallolyticus subsp. gallolyticus]
MSQYIIEAIQVGILETLEMTFFSALIAYLIGLPLGIILYATARGRLLENRIINLVLGVIVNILRSLPFLILLVLLIPFTRLVTGSSIGTIASIVPLTIGTIPIVARMVEASLCEVQPGIIEAATAMGASPFYIILHFILPEATPSLLQGGCDKCCYCAWVFCNGRCHWRRRFRRNCSAIWLLSLSKGCPLVNGGFTCHHGDDYSGSWQPNC